MQKDRFITFFCLFLFSYCVDAGPLKEGSTCQSCHGLVDGKINVHLVPHSHDDVGWLKTFSQYYYGTGTFNRYEDAGVQYIISSTVKALKKNSDRRFIQVETAFFWKWWQFQNDQTKQDVIDLVNSGQLEMINGAWSMNDEATTNYQSIIDQFTWGFRILEKTVGKCGRPRIGWQIDPFGHSREHASLLKQFGFEGLVIGRLDYRDKAQRINETNLDFIWTSSNNLEKSELFTTMFPDFYVDEPGYHFDAMYRDSMTDRNTKEKVEGFAAILDKYRKYFKTANIMMPMGNDFTYQVAERNYENMDRLIKGFENHSTYNVFYSTPSCYVKAVQDELQQKSVVLKTKQDDFFPYASGENKFWTGYFTSRPTLKRFERIGNNILQSVKQLATFSRIKGKEYDVSTLDLRQAMGVLQHHDAITGTEKQAVADDYSRMLHSAIRKAEEPTSDILINLLKLVEEDIALKFSTCLLANTSICTNSQKDRFLVAVQNPLSRTVTHYVRLPVDGDSYKITGPDGEEVYDIFDTIHSFDYIGEKIGSKELVYAARDIPPLGVKLYYVEKSEASPREYKAFKKVTAEDGHFGDELNGFSIDTSTGKLKSVTIKGITQEVTQEFLYYTTRWSGAYVFNPSNETKPISTQPFVGVKFAKGHLVDECLQIVNDEISQIIRVYKNKEDAYIEFDWLVGDLQYDDDLGKEVITRYTIKDFNNTNIFYTDSNGREVLRRELNHRSDYTYDPSKAPISSNYYPVTSKIVIKDETKEMEMAILNDRAQGGTSLNNGVVELMVHRKLVYDDGLGVDETLDEMQYGKGLYARGQHFLTFGSTSTSENGTNDSEEKVSDRSTAAFERDLAQRKLLAPWVLVADATPDDLSLENITTVLNFKFEGLTAPLPDNVQILTLEPWIDSYILRLEHTLEKDEDDQLSKPVTIDLTKLFTLFEITELRETTLGANEYLQDANGTDLKITLNPMQIRTFIIKTDQNDIGGHDDSDGDDNDDLLCSNGRTVTPVLRLGILIVLNILNCIRE